MPCYVLQEIGYVIIFYSCLILNVPFQYVHFHLSEQFSIERFSADSYQNTHTQVKAKILERMEEWTRMFSKNPDLGIMEQAYMRLKSQSKFALSVALLEV